MLKAGVRFADDLEKVWEIPARVAGAERVARPALTEIQYQDGVRRFEEELEKARNEGSRRPTREELQD